MSTIAAPRTATFGTSSSHAGSRTASRVPSRTAAPADRPSMRSVYLRRRLGVAALLALGLSTVGYGFADAGDRPATEVAATGRVVHVVRAGETLWGIARAAQPDGDVRPLVDRLDHQLHGAVLSPGMRLIVG